MYWGESAHQQLPQTSQVVPTWEERHQLSQAQRAQSHLAPPWRPIASGAARKHWHNILQAQGGPALSLVSSAVPQQTHPDVTLAREESLRDAGGIERSTSDVQACHECQPAYLPHGGCFQEPLRDDKVQSGNHPTKTQT